MLAKRMMGWVLALLSVPFVAMAERPYIDIEQRLTAEQLREVGLSSQQLELLNRMLREASAKRAKIVASQSGESQDDDDRGRASFASFNDKPISSRLKGSVSGWEPGTEFELENGQRWKVLKGSMKLREPMQAPEILVVPGIAGRWFLQVDEDLPKARVYRTD